LSFGVRLNRGLRDELVIFTVNTQGKKTDEAETERKERVNIQRGEQKKKKNNTTTTTKMTFMMTKTQEGLEFTKLLHSRTECSLFRSFVKKSACDENLMFWIEIELHKKEIAVFAGSFKVEYARKRNEEIFNKYFKVGGDYELNLDSDAVDEIREKLFQGSEEEANSFHLFDRAQDEVYLLMLNDSFSKFKKSNEYIQHQQKLESGKGKPSKKATKKKGGSFLGTSSVSSSDEAADQKIKKRSSISSLSKLFLKPKHPSAKDIPVEEEYSGKLNEAPIRRTFSGLNHQEITETPQATWDSMKIRPRANSLEVQTPFINFYFFIRKERILSVHCKGN